MNVSQCMSTDVKICTPETSLREAAQLMKQIDAGILPVGENDRLVGMISDRDIAIRAVAAGLGPDTPIREAMTRDLCYCYDDEELEDVAANMGGVQVRRLPVINRDKRLVGIVSLGDIAKTNTAGLNASLGAIAQPGGQHWQ
jgi:CBS domain-containing protein